MLIKCSCDGYLGNKAGAAYQNEVYGHGMRAGNVMKGRENHARCTVCGAEVQYKKDKEDKSTKK